MKLWALRVITPTLQMRRLSFREAKKLEYGHTAGERSSEGLNAGRVDPVACVFTSETHIKTLRSLFLPEGLLLRDEAGSLQWPWGNWARCKEQPPRRAVPAGSRFRMEPQEQCLWTLPRPRPQTPAPKARGPGALLCPLDKGEEDPACSPLEPNTCFSSKRVCWTLLCLQVAKPTSH